MATSIPTLLTPPAWNKLAPGDWGINPYFSTGFIAGAEYSSANPTDRNFRTVEGKTLEECKDDISIKYGYNSYIEVKRNAGIKLERIILDEASYLFASQKAGREWISVKDMPNHNERVIGFQSEDGQIYNVIDVYFLNGMFFNSIQSDKIKDDCQSDITHWLPLPPAPEEKY